MNREQAKELFRKDKDAYGKPKHIMQNVDHIFDQMDHILQGMCLVETCNLKITPEEKQQEKYVEGWNEAIQRVRERFQTKRQIIK